MCNNDFEANLDNFYKNNKSKDGLHSYCKECTKKKSKKWMQENDDKYREKMRERKAKEYESQDKKEYQRAWAKKQRELGYQKEWQDNNKEKLSEYRVNKYYNKTHEISNEEWECCKQYFNYECAYCGLHMNNHFVKYGVEYKLYDFHKEHVDHEGENDISNCVPSCKSCNSKKWKHKFEDWYNRNNDVYDIHRFNKIIKWLGSDYKDCLK